jgi:hypothetical protein
VELLLLLLCGKFGLQQARKRSIAEKGTMNNLENNATETTPDFWDLLDNAPDYAKAITGLVSWATNYDHDERNPLSAFLLLVEFASEDLGEFAVPYQPKLSWLELDLVGQALVEYSARPYDCRDWLKKLFKADREL